MADNLTKKQRSYCMSKIRSKWTVQEKKVHNFLTAQKIKHKMHPKLLGNPDILLLDSKTVIFVHGCFWHKCPKCYKEPKSNRRYWLPKIEHNIKRDKKNAKLLKENGYSVIKIWEHKLKKGKTAFLKKVIKDGI